MHQYQLQKYNGIQSRHRCPACQNRRKTFSLYVNTDTNEPLAAHVGRCSREVKCGYHCKPREFFAAGGVNRSWFIDHSKKVSGHQPSTMNHEHLTATLRHYHRNHLVTYLTTKLGADATRILIDKYRIGTSKHWPGATVFWQIDAGGNIRTGKIMLYNALTGKRVKLPYNHITWVHKVLKLDNYHLSQCLFGEHLLPGSTLPVAVGESEKTALIAAAKMPHYLWLACGSLSNLTTQRCAALKGRRIYLFPDLNAYDAWAIKARQLAHLCSITISPLLQQVASGEEKVNGLDIGDYLVGNV